MPQNRTLLYALAVLLAALAILWLLGVRFDLNTK
jgi:hypothetical protein